jgi:hypothetical protein
MIQLANDPDASRSFERAAARSELKEQAGDRRVRSGHSWPFLSRTDARQPRQENTDKPAAQESGS